MQDKDYLFRIDPAASASYNMYKASQKDGEGSFLDFLLKYDSNAANEGDFSSVLGKGENAKMISSLMSNSSVSPEALSSAIKNNTQDEADNLLSGLLNSSMKNLDMLNSRAHEIINDALNSKLITDEQKQLIASKYTEFSKETDK
ncbi:hypothetical protein [Campylobacter suis]|uniref:Uncharacterized protein n=1 Tax=Campylobacter suis TaxID=2790657 RepID=A0ABM8Q0Y4_9BACT|nr:hypothetical protein [Campylobacter suis]CAD7286444.1 hypothetical protein LMG8286_00277 [Campylobacter suis]